MFINVINASISAVWLILAVTILRLLLRRSPRWIVCLLWGMAGLRLVLPFSVRSIFSLIPSAQTLPPTIIYDDVPQINSGVPFVNNSVNPILSENFIATPQYSANPMQILLGIFEMLWAVGMIVMVLYLLVSYIVLRIRMSTATRLENNIYQSERENSPFVMGIFRPRIFIPYGMEESAQGYVLAHEQAHIRRGDHIVKPLAFLVLTVHWFNPFVWLAYILLCRDIELACDQRVIKELSGADRKAYSRALVSGSAVRRTASACPLAFGEVGVKTRVKSVLSYKKPALWVIIAAVAMCVVTAVCFLTDPVERSEIFGKSYAETELVYQSPYLSSIGKPSREYRFTIDGRIVLAGENGEENLGRLSAIDLTAENFDDLFSPPYSSMFDDLWADTLSPDRLRRENRNAWMVTNDSDMILVLHQNSGAVYIAYGYNASAGGPGRSELSRVFLMEEAINTAATDLDTALNKAAMDYNKGGYLPGQFRCETHTILGTECESVDESTQRVTAYAIVLYQEYSLVDGVPQNVSGSSCPVAVTFDVSDGGEYTLVEYWEPQDGTLYVGSLKEKFPAGIPWNTEIGHDNRKAECLRQACEYFGVSVSNAGGADDPQMITTTTAIYIEASDGTYTYRTGYDIFGSCNLILKADGTAMLTFGMLSSYIAVGSYELSADTLLLTTGDSYKNEYVFRASDDGFVFDAENSAPVPHFKPSADSKAVSSVPHGAEFVFETED